MLGAQLSGEGCACCRAGATADDPHVVGVAVDERDVASHLGGPEVVLVEDDVAGSGVRAYVVGLAGAGWSGYEGDAAASSVASFAQISGSCP